MNKCCDQPLKNESACYLFFNCLFFLSILSFMLFFFLPLFFPFIFPSFYKRSQHPKCSFWFPFLMIFVSQETEGGKRKLSIKKYCLHLVRQLGWRLWEISLSEVMTRHGPIRHDEIFFRIHHRIFLQHLSFFLSIYYMKISGFEALRVLCFPTESFLR